MDVETVLDKAGTHPLETYIERRQAKKGEWVALCPILEFCDRETGFEGVGRRREIFWRKMVATNQLSDTLRYIFFEAMEQRWGYGRRGKTVGRDRDIEESEDGSVSNEYWYAGRETGDAHLGK